MIEDFDIHPIRWARRYKSNNFYQICINFHHDYSCICGDIDVIVAIYESNIILWNTKRWQIVRIDMMCDI